MKAFTYVNAANEKEAIAALQSAERGKMLPMAGGMDLLGMMKDYIVSPDRVVSIKGLDQGIAAGASAGGGLRIGAAVKISDLAEHAEARKLFPALVTAAEGVGTPQIRNMGTVGGNIMQRPRCWYFRNEEFNCLKKGGSRCFAVEGENQFLVIAKSIEKIYRQNAQNIGLRFRVAGPNGAREIDAGEFFQMPNTNLYGENVLQPNEIVTHVILPAPGQRSASYEVRFKQSHDWPLAAASVNLVMSGSVVKSARIVMGAVAPVPWRVAAAERVLAGKAITEAIATEAANAALAGARPMSGNKYKIQIAKTAVKRAILAASRA